MCLEPGTRASRSVAARALQQRVHGDWQPRILHKQLAKGRLWLHVQAELFRAAP